MGKTFFFRSDQFFIDNPLAQQHRLCSTVSALWINKQIERLFLLHTGMVTMAKVRGVSDTSIYYFLIQLIPCESQTEPKMKFSLKPRVFSMKVRKSFLKKVDATDLIS